MSVKWVCRPPQPMSFIHHNNRISPELENSQLTNHCLLSPALRGRPGTPDLSRNGTGAWSLESHSWEHRTPVTTSQRPSAPLSPQLEQRLCWTPGASLQETWRATGSGSRHRPASWAAGRRLGPIFKVPLGHGGPGAHDSSKKDRTLPAGVTPAGKEFPQAPLGLRT